MISTADFRTGLNIEVDHAPYQVIWFQHHKPGKGGAVMRVKLRNLATGSIVEQTFKSGERFRELSLERRPKQFLYHNDDDYVLMDLESYEQIFVPSAKLGTGVRFLKEGMEVQALYLDGQVLAIELPTTVTLKVTETVPGVKGDSVQSLMKPATLETGVEIRVPLFVKPEDIVKVDTRTGEYQERVS